MKKSITLFLSCVFLLTLMAVSCKPGKNPSENTGENTHIVSSDSVKNITIEENTVDSIVFIPVEGEPIRMVQSDCKPLSSYLHQAVYDTELNQSGIMIKMQVPDYTVVFYYKDKNPDQSDWLMIWKENGRTKFDNEWYYLNENTRSSIYELLDKYVDSAK